MKFTFESLNSGASPSTSVTDMLSQTVRLVSERRRYSIRQKLALVRETYLPGHTVLLPRSTVLLHPYCSSGGLLNVREPCCWYLKGRPSSQPSNMDRLWKK